MRVVVTGGGTGGHVVPNIAVIEELKRREISSLLYIGSGKDIERKAAKAAGVEYKAVSCGKLRRYFSWENLKDFFRVPVGVWQSFMALRSFKPEVVFSKGGYVSVPVVIAAWMRRIQVVIHESDISPGLANKICFRFASKVCLSFEETLEDFGGGSDGENYGAGGSDRGQKLLVTGNIVRKDILSGVRERGMKFAQFNNYRPVLLVMGGSQGAQQINQLVRDGLGDLLKKFQIVHLVGRGNIDISIKKQGYRQYEFLNEQLKDVYAAADVVVSRGGANSLCELAVLKKKVLVIPLVGKASRGEQLDNANFFAKKFGWSVLSEVNGHKDFVENLMLAFHNEMDETVDFENGLDAVVDLLFEITKK